VCVVCVSVCVWTVNFAVCFRATNLAILRVGAWALANLCDGQPAPKSAFDLTLVLTELVIMLYTTDNEVLTHTCWALSHLCEGQTIQAVAAVVAAGVCPRLVAFLAYPVLEVKQPALRCIGNIVCADAEHDFTQHIVLLGAVPLLRNLVEECTTKDMQKEVCWTLSNIAAGSVSQIQAVLESGVVPKLVELALDPVRVVSCWVGTFLLEHTETRLAKCSAHCFCLHVFLLQTTDTIVSNEACWVLINATSCGSYSQVSSRPGDPVILSCAHSPPLFLRSSTLPKLDASKSSAVC